MRVAAPLSPYQHLGVCSGFCYSNRFAWYLIMVLACTHPRFMVSSILCLLHMYLLWGSNCSNLLHIFFNWIISSVTLLRVLDTSPSWNKWFADIVSESLMAYLLTSTTLLRHNSHLIRFAHLQYTAQCGSVYDTAVQTSLQSQGILSLVQETP